MEMTNADLSSFIALFLNNLADEMDKSKIEYFTPAQMREHADLIRLRELEKDFFNS